MEYLKYNKLRENIDKVYNDEWETKCHFLLKSKRHADIRFQYFAQIDRSYFWNQLEVQGPTGPSF